LHHQPATSLHISPVRNKVTYNTLLDGCARYGSFDRGLEVMAATGAEWSVRLACFACFLCHFRRNYFKDVSEKKHKVKLIMVIKIN